MRKIILALSFVFFIPVFADSHELQASQISMPLKAQIWLKTKTAKVTVTVNAADKNTDVSQMQSHILEKLHSLYQTDWHIVFVNRYQGQSGLTNIAWKVQARIPLDAVNTIADKVKSISQSGMQFSLSNTDYSPSFSEQQQGNALLRTEIYKMAKAALAQAKTAFPEENYKIKNIAVNQPYKLSTARPNFMVEAQAHSQPISVARQLTMTARVVLAAKVD